MKPRQQQQQQQQERLVRVGPLSVAPLRAGFLLVSHVLGHARLVCDARVVEILDWHARPRRPAEVAAHFEESEEGVAFVLGHLVQAQLLAPERFDAHGRIRSAFASRRAALPPVAPSAPRGETAIDRWCAPAEEDVSGAEQTPFALTPRSRLVLSPHVASLGLGRGETIALHPLGPRLHLRALLWRLARAFREPTTIADAAKSLRLGSTAEVVDACRFLVLRRLLWASRAAERRAFEELADRLDVGADGPSARQWSELQHQWTDVATPYDWEDVRRMRAFGRVAVVGQCQINFVGAALQRLAQRHHVHLELFAEATPSPALARSSWSAVFLTLADGAAELHDAAAREDWAGAARAIPRLVAYADELVTAARRSTASPLAVISVGMPSLATAPETAGARHRRARIYAELNERLANALRGGDTFLVDESGFAAGSAGRVVLDDEYTGSAHHCTYNPRFWIPLTQWSPGAPAAFPAGDPQAGASDAIAVGLFELLRRRYEPSPVRVVAFDPDDLLWPGRIAEKPSAHESLQRSTGRPDYQFYCGVNEALLAVRARGAKLVCVSSLPRETLAARWNVPESSTSFVSGAHLDAVVRSARDLERHLAERGVRPEECVWIATGGRPDTAPRGARVFAGDRWGIKRYLLTAPELTPPRGAVPGAQTPSPLALAVPPQGVRAVGEEEVSDAQIEAQVDRAIERHLRLAPGGALRTADLRALGLDSLTALELVHDIEAKLGVQFADRDLTVATIYSRTSILEGAVRGVRARGAVSLGENGNGDGSAALSLARHDRITDLLLDHVAAARHPWQFKALRSTRPNDYEYAGWSTLLERARGYADLFAELGAEPGDVVTLMLPQGLALVAAFLAAILHDYVPSIVAAPSEKLSEAAFAAWFGEVAARSGTRVVLCSPPHEELVRACLASLRASCAPRATGIAVSSRPPSPAPRGATPIGRRADRPLLLQHSSGTTGLKKGVLLDERGTLAQVRHLARALRCDAGGERGERDLIVSWAPLYHDMGLIACLLLPLLADLPVVMMSPFDWLRAPEVLLREVTRERGTLTWMPNFAFMYCAKRIPDAALDGIDLSSWRGVVNCSEPVTDRATDAFHRRFAGVGLRRSALSASYAMAETTFAVTQVPPGRGLVSAAVDARLWRGKGIAKPAAGGAPSVVLTGSGEILGGTEVEIVDPRGDGAPLKSGHAGEIRVRGESLMRGYFGDAEATAAALRDGWYYTGDLGVVLGRELYVTGRKKDLVIVGGHNVYPHDVEESVGAIPGIKAGRVVALGVPDEALDTERLVLLAETEGIEGDDASEARAALKERVRAHVSSVFGVTAYDVRLYGERTLEKSTSGKLSRSRNRALYLAQVATEAGE